MNINRRGRTAFNNKYNNNNLLCSFIKSRKKNNNSGNKCWKKLFLQQKEQEEKLLQQQKEQQNQQKQQEKLFLKVLDKKEPSENNSAFSHNKIWNSTETFIYLPEENKTFEAFNRRYEDLFTVDCEDWTKAKKVRLLLRKLGTTEYSKFVDYILPKKTSESEFSKAIKLLSELFSPNMTLFHKRWKCFNLSKPDDEDYLTFDFIVNKHCDDFRLGELSTDDFKCFIFAQGLVSSKNSEIRRRVLSKLESESGLTLQKLSEDCQREVSIKNDPKTSGNREGFMSEGQTTSWKITPLGKVVKTKSMSRHNQRIDDQSKNWNYPQVHAIVAVDNIGQQIVSTRTKLVTSVVKLATKQHAVGTKEIKTVRQARSNNKTEKNRRKYVTVNILDKKKKVDLQLDSGSDLSIINLHRWKKLKKTNAEKNKQNSPCNNRWQNEVLGWINTTRNPEWDH